MKEKDVNLNIMLACNEVLLNHGFITVLSRTEDENDPVIQEVEEANSSGADLAVSFHTNAGKGNGSESLYYGNSVEGKRIAELCEEYTKVIGQNSRGIKRRDDLWFIKATNMPAVICECAFIDHDIDNDIIDTVFEQQKFGKAYAKAILEYFNIKYLEKKDVKYTVQVGAFSDINNANVMCNKIKMAGFDAFVKAK